MCHDFTHMQEKTTTVEKESTKQGLPLNIVKMEESSGLSNLQGWILFPNELIEFIECFWLQ